MIDIFTWVMTLLGCVGFWLSGKKVWWAWYVNLGNQLLWIVFALLTGYYAFIFAAVFYTVVFSRNAYIWTRDRNKDPLDDFDMHYNEAAYIIDGDIYRTYHPPREGDQEPQPKKDI